MCNESIVYIAQRMCAVLDSELRTRTRCITETY